MSYAFPQREGATSAPIGRQNIVRPFRLGVAGCIPFYQLSSCATFVQNRIQVEFVTIYIKDFVKASLKPTPWDLGNQVLYKLCKAYPHHRTDKEIIAKILLIGRTYAAAIERRKKSDRSNEDFYVDPVASAVRESNIDAWLNTLKRMKTTTTATLPLVIKTHQNVTRLFEHISGLNKRALASKYLHFHYPNTVFIYDSRVCEGMRKLREITDNGAKWNGEGDSEYAKFATKCVTVRDYIMKQYKVSMTPRILDTFLLKVARKGR